ncbi:anaerobic ribonucleoside triphosphate reductase [Desulfurococcus mucosus]|uniref:Anaerobic ribonucleoside-triphosphate reductase n=1 Tax=Desulfurococcus mucosus (strain ATCC 35584 / DSM 2162 / JCM 9187 / O7/1) TaxID=765177 RepID=E8RAC0_DESM0|nr:anaerobic ribonucleoside triphosphate reductase [Desulfurococcus mucosus]ADV65426.1 anaerobic ribonucleoside-triphosphate reductase [Desulfurococcus mucosus DSM 2162]
MQVRESRVGVEDPFTEYIRWSSLDVNENANRYIGPGSFFSYLLEEYMKRDLLGLLPGHILRAHRDGLIYIHKLPHSLYIPYCTGHSLARLLEKGLKTPTVISRPARHLDTFVDHVANYLITLQHYFTGAQAFSSVEWYAGPFIRGDGADYRAVRQNIQRLLYNLNYPTRIGLQTPFTNFTIIMDAARKALEGDYAVYDGRKTEPLGAYEKEAKTFLLALFENYMNGDSVGQPFTFPIPTLMTTAKMLWEDPEIHEAVFKTAAKRGSFYWLNTRVVDPDASYAMCCRLSIQKNELLYAYKNTGFSLSSLRKDAEALREEYWGKMERQRFGGLWAMPDITGSVNVVDVNLPRLALESRGDDDRFWELYDEALGLVREAVNWFRNRYVRMLREHPGFYYMITEYMPEFPGTHFNTIGLIGLPEAAAILMQEPKLWLDGGRSDWLRAGELMRRIVEHATETARRWMREEGTPWNVEEVPAESASPRMAEIDLKRHPELAEYLPDPSNPVYSTSIAPYYASEMELPERIEVEAMVQKYFTGGVMMHIFLAEEPEPEALAKLAKRIMETDIVYWSFTPALTYCPRCNKTYTGLHRACPRCGSEEVEVWSRIIGYYRPLKNWNPQRRKEFWTRHHYGV